MKQLGQIPLKFLAWKRRIEGLLALGPPNESEMSVLYSCLSRCVVYIYRSPRICLELTSLTAQRLNRTRHINHYVRGVVQALKSYAGAFMPTYSAMPDSPY